MQLEALAVERQRRVDEIDRLAVPVEHLARDARDAGDAREAGDRRGEPPRIGPGVVVEECDVLAARGATPWLHPAGETGVARHRDHAHVGMRGRMRSTEPSPDALSTTTISR